MHNRCLNKGFIKVICRCDICLHLFCLSTILTILIEAILGLNQNSVKKLSANVLVIIDNKTITGTVNKSNPSTFLPRFRVTI